MFKTFKHIIKHLLTAVSFAVLAVALLFIAGHFGLIDFYKPYVVTSGSMEPAIETGSVVLIRSKPFGYTVGDIITFTSGKDSVTTHRVYSLQLENNQIAYQTKGDANEEPDNNLVAVDQVLGSVSYTIPKLGLLAGKAKTPQGFIALVIIPATIIVYEELKKLLREIKDQLSKLWHKLSRNHPTKASTSPTTKRHKFPILPAILVPVVGAFFVITSLSVSYFSDSETSLGNVLGAADLSQAEAQFQRFLFPELFDRPNPTPPGKPDQLPEQIPPLPSLPPQATNSASQRINPSPSPSLSPEPSPSPTPELIIEP